MQAVTWRSSWMFWKNADEWKHMMRGIVGVSKADTFRNTSVAKTSWFVRVWWMRAGENKRKSIPNTDQTSPLVWRRTFNLREPIGEGRMTNKPWFGIELFIYVTWRPERKETVHIYLIQTKQMWWTGGHWLGQSRQNRSPIHFGHVSIWQIQTFCSNLGNQERLSF